MDQINEQELLMAMDERTQVGYQLARLRIVATRQQQEIEQLRQRLSELENQSVESDQ